MEARRRQRRLGRFALGLAVAGAAVAASVSPARAEPDDTVLGWSYASAEGWSGKVDTDSGMPLSAGISEGYQFAIAADSADDPYLTDVSVRQGESNGGPDGDEIAFRNALRSRAIAQAQLDLGAGFVDDFPRQGESQGGPDGGARP
jgi:hypothetical protein